jgi:hypothetical protein
LPSVFDRLRRSLVDPGDLQIIDQLRSHGADLSRPRDTVHWLYFADQSAAGQASGRLKSEGYSVRVGPSAKAGSSQWSVEAHCSMVVSSATVPAVRLLMELVAREQGGEYDGWEASVKP